MQKRIASELKILLGRDRVHLGWEERRLFSMDALGIYRAFSSAPLLEQTSDVVVHPQSTEHVVSIARLAHTNGIPLVPFGSGTGVMGGVTPLQAGITVNMQGLNKIWQIDRISRTTTVGPGVILGDLQNALSKENLMLGHDPWSQPIASVGGAISTNGVGYLAARYGPIGEQLLGLEIVLPNGQILETPTVSKPSSGPNLNHLFVGSEGIFGFISKATLRVFPQPEKRSLHALTFDSFEAGFGAIMELYSLNLWPAMVDFAEEPLIADNNGDGDIILYLGFEGFQEEVEAAETRALKVCRQAGAQLLAQDKAKVFWQARHSSAERYQRETKGKLAAERRQMNQSWQMDYLHVAIPPSQVLEYRKQCRQILIRYGVPVHEWSIWGRPEFFSFLIGQKVSSIHIPAKTMERAVDAVLTLSQDMGGTMEYCHGVGLKLAHLMERDRGTGMDVIRQMKNVLDPHHIMNPGKLGM